MVPIVLVWTPPKQSLGAGHLFGKKQERGGRKRETQKEEKSVYGYINEGLASAVEG